MIETRGIAVSQENLAAAKMAVPRRLPRGGALICLLGPDGSGRWTQAAALAETLRAQGLDAVHTPARWDPHPLLARRLSSGGRSTLTSCRTRAWKSLVLLDHARQTLPKVGIPLLMGRTVVADRYVYDTLVDLSLALGCAPDDLLSDFLLRLFPRPDLVILLDLSPKTCAARKGDETLEGALAERRAQYLRLGGTLGTDPVDAELSPTQVHAEIRRRVWKRLGL